MCPCVGVHPNFSSNGEKSRWELYKDAVCCLEQIHKAVSKKKNNSYNSHFTNHPRKASKTCWPLQESPFSATFFSKHSICFFILFINKISGLLYIQLHTVTSIVDEKCRLFNTFFNLEKNQMVPE